MRYKLILWDFDGTIASTSEDVWRSINYAACACGSKLPEGFISNSSNLSKSTLEIFKCLIPYPGFEFYKKFDSDISNHYRNLNNFHSTHMYAGIARLILKLKKCGVINAIVTNKPLDALEKILNIKKWIELFDSWISPDSLYSESKVYMSKKEMISLMINKYNISPFDCVYIGDSYSDVESSRENCVDCIAVSYGDGEISALKLARPKYLANCVNDISSVLFSSDIANEERNSLLEVQ